MNPWLETVGVIFIALLGILLGRAFSTLRKPYWTVGYFLSIILISMLAITRTEGVLGFVPPFSYLTAGRIRFVIVSLAVTIGLTTPLSRLPYRFEKFAIGVLMTVVVIWFSVLPFLVPALIRDELASLETRIDPDGICFQTTDFTCAPAAAVTALRKLGLSADEGEIAILSHSSPVAGTLPECLSSALENRYGAAGLRCQYRHFDSLAQLKNAGLTLVILRDAFLSDHCVTVLEVSDHFVTFADPVTGKKTIPSEQFEKIWRSSGIVLNRDSAQSI